MKVHANSLLLGFFIVGAMALALGGFLALNTSGVFGHHARFVVFLSDSAEGLRAGTSVNLHGVRVGEVERVRVYYEGKEHRSLVGLYCRITKDVLQDWNGENVQLTDSNVVKRLIGEGMFARLETAGIVGAKYIDLGFRAPAASSNETDLPPTSEAVVPTAPSPMEKMKSDLGGVLAHLRETDFPGIAQKAKQLLGSADRQVNELQTNHMTDHFSSAAAAVGRFMKSEQLKDTVARIHAAAGDLQKLMTNLDARVPVLADHADKTLERAGETAQDLRDFLALRSQLGEQAHELMEQLNQTASVIQQLADFLDRHPNALISGRADMKKESKQR